MLKKIKKKKGFTLVESLVAILILVLLSSVAANAVFSAISTYSNIVDSANAQLLLSTTISEIRDELSTATDIEASYSSFTYTSSITGDRNCIQNSSKGIAIVEYLGIEEKQERERLLVSIPAASKNLICSYKEVQYNDGILAIYDINVKRNGVVIAHLDEYMVKAG